MSEDRNRVEARRWLAQAENDLRFAELGIAQGFFAQACFLSQQAAEKALTDLAPFEAYTREQADRAAAAAGRFIELARVRVA